MQTVVLKLDIHDDDKCKRKAMKIVSTIPGVDSISMDTKQQKLTLVGNMDPITVVGKLRKVFHTEVLSIGPFKEPVKEKEKEKPKDQPQVIEYISPFQYSYYDYSTYPRYGSYFY